MAIPSFGVLKRWVGKNLTNQQWDFNFRQVVDWFTDGTANVSFSTLASTGLTVSGNVTAATFTGDGSGLTGVSGSGAIGGYELYDKYLYSGKNGLGQLVALGKASINGIGAYIACDSGVQLDPMAAIGNWTTAQADASGLAVDASNYVEGGSAIKWNKSGTSGSTGGIKRINFTSTNLTGKKVRVWIYIPTVSAGTANGVRLLLASGGGVTNYKYWDKTTDVNGAGITSGKWQLFEADPATAQSGAGGSYDNTAFTSLEVDILLSGSAATFTAAAADHVVYYPDTTTLDLNILVNNVALKSGVESYSFPNLTAGVLTTRSASFTPITSLSTGDIISVNIVNAGTYGGQDVTVYIK